MPIKKEDMVPGVRLRILPRIRWGIAYSKGAPDPLSIEVTDYKKDVTYDAVAGDLLEVVKKPRRTGPAMANCARVKILDGDGTAYEGEAFWAMLRVSCEIETPAPGAPEEA